MVHRHHNLDDNNQPSLILGISIFGHDSSCALVDGQSGKILYALTEERFSNRKHDGNFPTAALANILKKINDDKLGSITHIATNIDPNNAIKRLHQEITLKTNHDIAKKLTAEISNHLEKADLFHPQFFPLNYLEALMKRHGLEKSVCEFLSSKISWYCNFYIRFRKVKHYLQQKFPDAIIIHVDHHLCHAASAFYCSGFDQSAILTIDGQGEDATATLNFAQGNKIDVLATTSWPHSLGALYMQLAWYLGFNGDDARYRGFGDEFKVMGMAAYGKPIYLEQFEKICHVKNNGEFEFLFEDYLELQLVEGCPGFEQPLLSKNFFDKFGKRREPHEPIEQKHYDIAASGQALLEKIATEIAKKLKALCPMTQNICIAGGVGLNGLMNMKIFETVGFQNIFIQPAAGDDGTSLGAALYFYHRLAKENLYHKLPNAFLGLAYDESDILTALKTYDIKFHTPDNLYDNIGRLLHDGKIIARYTGRGEFGPRALGHRSILANPCLPTMKDDVNAKIKHREAFRPFAPACLETHTQNYFDIKTDAPYMLLICQAQAGVKEKIPAVVHDDNTARVQTVSADSNPDFFSIISAFHKYSGVPVVLNTSFNVNGEAIVETPLDALESFLFMGIDYLAIGSHLIARAENLHTQFHLSRQELINKRKARYDDAHFSPDMFYWPSSNPIETELVVQQTLIEIYKTAAEERLAVIEVLDKALKDLKRQ